MASARSYPLAPRPRRRTAIKTVESAERVLPDRVWTSAEVQEIVRRARAEPARTQTANPERIVTKRQGRLAARTSRQKIRRAATAGIGAAAATFLPGARIPDEVKAALGGAAGVLVDRALRFLDGDADD